MKASASPPTSRKEQLCLFAASLVLTFATVYLQWFSLGHDFLEGRQQIRHRQVLLGTAPDPWQYRLLSEWLVHALIRAWRWLGVEHPVVWGFLAFRAAQNLGIFLLAAHYYAALGLGFRARLLGLAGLTSAMTNAFYDSDLSFNTYSDIALYLLAGLALARERWAWVPALSLCAALNRETGALIPAMAFAVGLVERPLRRQALWASAVGALLFASAYLGVRTYLGSRPPFMAYGLPPGLLVAIRNLEHLNTWARLVATGGLFPLFALMAYRAWPPLLHALALAILPAWILVHLSASVLAESRLMLVPLAVVLIPGGLFAFGGTEPAR